MMSEDSPTRVPVEIRLANGTVKHLGLLCRESVENVFKKPKEDDIKKEITPKTLPQNQSSDEKSGNLTTASQATQCNTILLNKPKVTHRGTTVNLHQRSKCKQVQTPQQFLKPPHTTVSTQVELPGFIPMTNSTTTFTTASTMAQAENETPVTFESVSIKVEPNWDSMENETTTSAANDLKPGESGHLSLTNETASMNTSTASASLNVVPVCLYVKTQSNSTQTHKVTPVDKSTQCEGESAVNASPLEQALYVLRTVQQLWVFSYEVVSNFSGSHLLIMTRKDLLGVYGDGVEPIRVTLDMKSQCTINQLFAPILIKDLAKNEHQLDIGQFIDVLRPLSSTNLILCPGVNFNLDIKPSAIISTNAPFTRHMSNKCLVWYEFEKKSSGKIIRPMCLYCKKTAKNLSKCKLREQKKRSLPASESSDNQYTPACKQREQINILIEELAK